MQKRKEGIVMKVNWKLRIKNKVTLTALVGVVIAFVYQILALLGITPPISESEVVEIAGIIINLLVLIGVVVDPTTKGFGDSDNAMSYESPKEELEAVQDEEGVV